MTASLCAAARPVPVCAQPVSPLVFDAEMSVAAGSALTVSIGRALARLEDVVVPHRLVEERGVLRRTANVTYRLARLAWFDLPQEGWLLVANHEVFGHGARLRDRFDGPIGYRLGVPPPYGPGGGSTSFDFDRPPAAPELLAVTTGGMEAGSVGAELMTAQAMARGRIAPRDAMRYLGLELDTLSYVLGTGDDPEEPGHDVFEFLQVYNAIAAEAGEAPLQPRTLRREVLVGLANPMVAFAVYGVSRYIWDGAADVTIPTISLAGVRYLPLLRYRLTPFGTEVAVSNVFASGARNAQIDVRVGRSIETRPWGISVRQTNVTTWGQWTLGLGADVWRQPPTAGEEAEPFPGDPRWGAAVRARIERPLAHVWFASTPMSLIVELGGKRAGFVPGEPLGGGLVVRAGVGLPFGR